MSDWLSGRMAPVRIGPVGWVLVAVRGSALATLVYGGLAVHLVVRGMEWLCVGAARPVTPWITQGVCRGAVVLLGIRLARLGTPLRGIGGMVANHGSWLDVFTLNACARVMFVAKSDVAGWPGIGWLARATGTLFIARKSSEARAQAGAVEARLAQGHHLLFFPEGTSSDGLRVLPFKSTLFAAFFSPALRDRAWVQPVSVVCVAPAGCDARFYGWWGDMAFAPHLLLLLATPRRGRVDVVFHPPLRVADFADRKALSSACEAMVRQGHARA